VIHFERSFDYELIRRILTHEKIWPHISDDYSPPATEFRPIESTAAWYIVVRDIYPDAGPEEVLGLWMFVPQNSVCWEVHTCLLPTAWGDRGQRAARMLPDWIWQHTHCRRIITNVPSTNRLALHFAVKAGMTIYGVNRASFLKHGTLCDQVCLGISPSDKTTRTEAETVSESIGESSADESCNRSIAEMI
jgi:RimJ/RimL family protein N-acetyltransferase